MTTPTIRQTLQGVQFLENVSAELIEELAGISSVVEIPSAQVIFRQGDLAKWVYLVLEGKVALEICAAGVGCKRILTIGPGDLLSWSPILQESRLTATARTLEPTRVVQLDGGKLLEMGDANPRLGYEFMKRAAMALARRLTATRMQLVDVYGTQMPQVADERKASQPA